MILRLSILKLFRPIFGLMVRAGLLLICVWLYSGEFNQYNMFGVSIILCFWCLPTLYLFFEYYIATRNKTIEVTSDYIKVSGYINVHCDVKDIRIIKRYESSTSIKKNNFPIQSSDSYYYAEVLTNDGKKLILTSVLKPNLDEALKLLKDVDVEYIKTWYSTIYW